MSQSAPSEGEPDLVTRTNFAQGFGTATGGGTATLTNFPGATNAPYTWIKVITPDGNPGFIPVWR